MGNSIAVKKSLVSSLLIVIWAWSPIVFNISGSLIWPRFWELFFGWKFSAFANFWSCVRWHGLPFPRSVTRAFSCFLPNWISSFSSLFPLNYLIPDYSCSFTNNFRKITKRDQFVEFPRPSVRGSVLKLFSERDFSDLRPRFLCYDRKAYFVRPLCQLCVLIIIINVNYIKIIIFLYVNYCYYCCYYYYYY